MKLILSCVPFDGGKSGISVCMRAQAHALADAGHDVTLVVEASAQHAFPGFAHLVLPSWAERPILSMLYHLFVLPFRLRRLHADGCIIAAANRRALAWCPCPTVAIVHDLSQYHIPAKYDAFRMAYIRHVLPAFVRRATIVAAISQSTANDLQRFWHIPPHKLRLAPNGLSLTPTHTPPPTPSWPQRLGLRKRYLLYISRLEHPGKNHIRLMEAFASLPHDLTADLDLVMPGADWNGADDIRDAARRSPCHDHFHFPGYISPDDLPDAYRHATAYVFPSLFEGFGLSLLEAMHHQIPCACSATSSLGELGQGAAILFNPTDTADIARALQTLLTDHDGNRQRIQAGLARLREFTWQRNAKLLTDALQPPRRPYVLGVPIDTCTMDDALDTIDAHVRHAHEHPDSHRCALLAFVNAHCLNVACHNQSYRDVLNRAAAVWPDGSGVRLAGRLLGFPVPANVNGTDMFPRLCQRPHSIFLLGARPGVAQRALENATRLFPHARLVGAAHGYFNSPDDERQAIAAVNACRPDILLVALGVPRQELWLAKHRDELHCGAAIAVGGLLDFVSGRIPRAPAWLRRCGLEWTYRLYQEPVRLFRRYVLGNPAFVLRVLLSRLRGA